MVKLIGYEIKKLFQYKLILMLLIFSTLLMAVVILKEESFEEYSRIRADKETYSDYVSATSGMSCDEAVEWLNNERDRERALYRENKNGREYSIKAAIINNLIRRYEYLGSYGGYVEKVIKQAEMIQKVSFYADDAFALSDAGKVEKDYSGLTDVAVSVDAALFAEAVAAFDTADYILLFQFLLIAILIFGLEDENVKRLLSVQNKGRHHVFFAKAAALICVSAVLVLFTYLYLMLIGLAYFGEGAFDVPVQSLKSFEESKYLITIGEFLILFAVFKVLSAWIFAFIFALFIILAGNVPGSLLSISASAMFYITYFMVDGRGMLSPLKYINPAAWFDVYRWLSGYANINFLTRAVSFEAAFAVGAVVLFIVLIVLSLHFYVKEGSGKNISVQGRLLKFSAGITGRIVERTAIVFHELYRLFAEGYRWLFTVAFIAVSVIVMNGLVKGADYDNGAYLYHLGRIEAEYLDETVEYLDKYMSYLEETDGYRASLDEEYSNGTISEDEYYAAIDELETDKQTIGGFRILYRQGEYLEEKNASGVTGLGFVDAEWSYRVLSGKFYMVVLELLLACAMFACFGGYLTSDYNVFGLIKSTYRGRCENQCMKIVNLLIYSLIIVVLPLAAYYTVILSGYESAMFDFGIQSIEMYSMCDLDISVGNMLVISMLFKYIGVVCIGLFMYFLSLYHLPKAVFQTIVLLAVVMPPVIEVMGAPIDFLGFSGFFYMEQLFKRGIVSVIMYAVAVFTGLTVFGLFAVRYYRGKQGFRRADNGKCA